MIPVLLYHAVADDPDDLYAVAPERFAEHVALAAGRPGLTISALADHLRAGTVPAGAVAVTFDDGFADNLAAFDVLAAHDLPATLYVTSGYVDRPRMLSAAQVTALGGRDGVEVGAHSVTHPHLDELPPDALREELAGSRAALADLLGTPPASFAYPHGAYSRRVRAATVDAGYANAAAVKNAISHAADDPFAIARFTVTRETPTALVEQVLAGRGAPRAWQRERLRTTAFRAYRRARA